jgi:hypothetical protein
MDQKKATANKLLHIRELWIEQARLGEGSPEQDAVLEKIRVLVAEYQAVNEKH